MEGRGQLHANYIYTAECKQADYSLDFIWLDSVTLKSVSVTNLLKLIHNILGAV